MEALQNTVYDKEEEIDKLKAELDEVTFQRTAEVEIDELKAELAEVTFQRTKFFPCVAKMRELQGEKDALMMMNERLRAFYEKEIEGLKGSLASAQRELSEMKSIDGATEVGSLKRELAEMSNELKSQKRKVVYAVAERDKALNSAHEMRLQIDDAQKRRKREFFYRN
jgi:hypothetical protein